MEALPSNSSVYQAQVLSELLDSYGAQVVLSNLWGRLASSPDHWFKLEPRPQGADFKFSEEVVRRRTELQIAADYYAVKNLEAETVMELVKAVVSTANLTSYVSNVTQTLAAVQLTVKDNETGFIYFEKALRVPAADLQVKALQTVSSSARSDQQNAGLVFNIEFDSKASTIEAQRQNEDFLS